MIQFDWQNYEPVAGCLDGKRIVLTGAADGIGKAVTIALAEFGATVLMLDKKARHLEKLYDQILERGFTEPIILPIDLMDLSPESATVLAQSIYDDLGHIDGVLHNAADLGSPSPLDQYDMKYWESVMQTNLHAPYFLTRALLPLLKQEHTTNLVFTSADVGRQAAAYWGAYAIAYAGLESQMTLWAEELENTSNISVNSLDPGPIRTSFRRRSHPGESQASLLAPHSITNAYLMLFAHEHGYHGQQLSVQP